MAPVHLIACVGFGVGTAMQKHGMATALPRISLGTVLRELPRVLRTILKSWIWLLGVGINLAGGLFQVLAIDVGEVSVVQPLVNVNVLIAAAIGVVVLREKVSWPKAWAPWPMIGGAILVTTTARSGPAVEQPPLDHGTLLWLGGGCAVVVVLLLVLATALPRRLPPELSFAAAAGLLFGLGATLIKVVSVHLASLGGLSAGLGAWIGSLLGYPGLWALVIVTVVGFVLFQVAFSHGRVAIVSAR